MFKRNYRDCGCNNAMEADLDELISDPVDNSIYDNSCNMYSNGDNDMSDGCSCGFTEPYSAFPSDPTIAESYVPVQTLNQVYKPATGLRKGTIFPELVNTYLPGQSMAEIAYLRRTNRRECNNR